MNPRACWAAGGLLALAAGVLPLAAVAAPDAADASVWLARIHSAASAGNYQGTMVVTVGGMISSTRVGHYAVGDQVFELKETLDGRQQRVLRHNDAVHTLWPQMRLVVVEKRDALALPSTPQSVQPQALGQYVFRHEGQSRVAGREALAFVLEPRDALRYAQRLWADLATGLMLRAEIMGQGPATTRQVLESTTFTDVAIGVQPQADLVLQEIRALRKLDGWRRVQPRQQRTSLEAEGWALAKPVPGFTLAGCVLRGMETAGVEQPVLQAVFTDGLIHVSLFIEPYKPDPRRAELQAQEGAAATLVARRGEHWVTAMGDVPVATLKMFADALRRRP